MIKNSIYSILLCSATALFCMETDNWESNIEPQLEAAFKEFEPVLEQNKDIIEKARNNGTSDQIKTSFNKFSNMFLKFGIDIDAYTIQSQYEDDGDPKSKKLPINFSYAKKNFNNGNFNNGNDNLIKNLKIENDSLNRNLVSQAHTSNRLRNNKDILVLGATLGASICAAGFGAYYWYKKS